MCGVSNFRKKQLYKIVQFIIFLDNFLGQISWYFVCLCNYYSGIINLHGNLGCCDANLPKSSKSFKIWKVFGKNKSVSMLCHDVSKLVFFVIVQLLYNCNGALVWCLLYWNFKWCNCVLYNFVYYCTRRNPDVYTLPIGKWMKEMIILRELTGSIHSITDIELSKNWTNTVCNYITLYF